MTAVLLAILLASILQPAYANPTIDRMVTTDYSYHPTYYPEMRLLLPMQRPRYYLSDGTSWPSGAGVARIPRVTFKNSYIASGFIFYHFTPPEDSILFQITDFSFGDHSSQGTLVFTHEIVLVAEVSSRTASVSGFATILDNTPTGALEFNYFSAPVGESVFFSIGITNRTEVWQVDSFLHSFDYAGAGLVNFTQVVPEPTSFILVLGTGVVLNWRRVRRLGSVSL